MVGEVNYGSLPKQRPIKVSLADTPSIGLQMSAKQPIVTSDVNFVHVEGEPGSSLERHTHMPENYQIMMTLEGVACYNYKDNEGRDRSVEIEPGEVAYLPGGFEHELVAAGNKPLRQIGVFPHTRYPRVEHILGTEGKVYDPTEKEVGLWYDPLSDDIVKMDESAVVNLETE
jgi:quercetin dioxygenase-like cupin family protein